MESGGILSRTVVAQIVHVHAISDVRNPALPADFFQTIEQFVLAVEAAVCVVFEIVGILELVRRDQLVPYSEQPRELDRIPLMRRRDRS